MNSNLLQWIDAFAGLKVVVVGDAMLDVYLEGATERFCREAPVPIVAVSGRREMPGGAATTAVNVHGRGACGSFVSIFGDDVEGETLRKSLEERGVTTEHLIAVPGRRTLTKQRVLAASQMLLRLDHGSTEP